MPLDRVPGHPLDGPVDHADGRGGVCLRVGQSLTSALMALGLKGKGRSPSSHARAAASVKGPYSGSQRRREGRTIQAAKAVRMRSSRAGPLKA